MAFSSSTQTYASWKPTRYARTHKGVNDSVQSECFWFWLFFPAQWSQNCEKCVWSLTSFQETKESSPWEKEKLFRYQQSDSSNFSVPTRICFANCLHICFICAYSCWTSPSSGGKWGMTEGRKALSPVISWAITMSNLMKRLLLSRHKHVTVHIKLTVVETHKHWIIPSVNDKK